MLSVVGVNLGVCSAASAWVARLRQVLALEANLPALDSLRPAVLVADSDMGEMSSTWLDAGERDADQTRRQAMRNSFLVWI
jgi:hypothetical protein